MKNPSFLKYQIALSLVNGLGSINTRKLIAYSGGVEAVFAMSRKDLVKIPGISRKTVDAICSDGILEKAEKEIEFIRKKDIKVYFYLDDDYPERLKNCPDAPVLLFVKGDVDLNTSKVLSIVGTREATNYGKSFVYDFMAELSSRGHQVIIASGMAHGIDSYAHKAALKHDLPTVAVLGHGLGTVYPAAHRGLSRDIANKGALVSEFASTFGPERHHFVRRNRIIAGLADATIVVESASTGGALITADMANSYNRDVFALPGRHGDAYSAGCNKLIKTNKATMIENVDDLEYIMGWDAKRVEAPKQTELFIDLSEDEKQVLELIKNKEQLPIDSIMIEAGMPMSRVSPILLSLEFAGLVKCLPGKVYTV